jgi:hypothetical protein
LSLERLARREESFASSDFRARCSDERAAYCVSAQGACLMLRMFCIAAVLFACCPAHAAKKAMPIDFLGEWCFASQDATTTHYTLPSWTQDERCTKILAIDQTGFYRDSTYCEAEKVHLKTDTAPSGTAFIATITARCRPDGPVTAGTLQTFEFNRYKGNMSVTGK